MPLGGGALALTLGSWGWRLSPYSHGLGLYGFHLPYAHVGHVLHVWLLLTFCTQGGEILCHEHFPCLWVMVLDPCIHAPMLKGFFICQIILLSILAHACMLASDWPKCHMLHVFMFSMYPYLAKSLAPCSPKSKLKNIHFSTPFSIASQGLALLKILSSLD